MRIVVFTVVVKCSFVEDVFGHNVLQMVLDYRIGFIPAFRSANTSTLSNFLEATYLHSESVTMVFIHRDKRYSCELGGFQRDFYLFGDEGILK